MNKWNDKGFMLLNAILLLFFVTLFLFSIVSWHDRLYRGYDSFETYYMQQATAIIERKQEPFQEQ